MPADPKHDETHANPDSFQQRVWRASHENNPERRARKMLEALSANYRERLAECKAGRLTIDDLIADAEHFHANLHVIAQGFAHGIV
jgi:hypothetical protein